MGQARRLSTNWVTAYTDAVAPITEAPSAYVIWSALSVISAVLKKKVWLNRGQFKVYPNQYIVLVGPPGVGKGTAIHPAHAFIKDYKTPILANYLSDRITAPKIIEKLANGFQTQSIINGVIMASKESTAIIQATELSTFLGSSDWMTSFLCDAWDRNEFEYDTKNKGSSHIKDMCVSLIGACTPDFIRKINGRQNAAEAINGGFTARTIFVFANEKSKKLAWPIALEDTTKGKILVPNLRADLETISLLKGEFSFDPQAKYRFTEYYKTIHPKDHDTDVVRYFKSRQDVHIFKVAMCLSAAFSDSLIIDLWCLNTAISLIEGVLATLDMTFRGVGESSLAEATAKIAIYIERKGLTSRQELIRDNHRHATMDDIDRILNTLHAMQGITIFSQGGKQFYKHLKNP